MQAVADGVTAVGPSSSKSHASGSATAAADAMGIFLNQDVGRLALMESIEDAEKRYAIEIKQSRARSAAAGTALTYDQFADQTDCLNHEEMIGKEAKRDVTMRKLIEGFGEWLAYDPAAPKEKQWGLFKGSILRSVTRGWSETWDRLRKRERFAKAETAKNSR
jgi:hypothetical protein